MPNAIFSDTPRLHFESLCAEHAAELFEMLCDPRVYEHLGAPPPASVATLTETYARMAAGSPNLLVRWVNYAVRLRETAALLGRVEATLVEARAEVAYLLGPAHWGRGYATEAMTVFQDHLRQNHGITEFWATTAPRNIRSIALLQRLGYREIIDGWPPLFSYETGDRVFKLRSPAFRPATPTKTMAGYRETGAKRGGVASGQ